MSYQSRLYVDEGKHTTESSTKRAKQNAGRPIAIPVLRKQILEQIKTKQLNTQWLHAMPLLMSFSSPSFARYSPSDGLPFLNHHTYSLASSISLPISVEFPFAAMVLTHCCRYPYPFQQRILEHLPGGYRAGQLYTALSSPAYTSAHQTHTAKYL